MSTIAVSIILCTRNRARSLEEALDSLAALQLPDRPCEVVVVDNGSTDSTAEAIRRRPAVLGPNLELRSILEPNPGKGHAYNAGIAAAQGEILLFTDDDARPSPSWLLQHQAAYHDPDVAAVQGRIELQFDSPPPPWLRRVHRTLLAEVDEGDEPIFPYHHHLVGANMSFRAEAAARIGKFNLLLGPGRSGFWDESEFSQRLLNASFHQCYQPGAHVRHLIAGSRLTPEYFLDLAFRHGVSEYIASWGGAFGRQPPPYARLARALIRRIRWELDTRRRGTRPVSSEVQIFDRMLLGNAWAHLQGKRRLTRRHGGDPAQAAASAADPHSPPPNGSPLTGSLRTPAPPGCDVPSVR